MMKTHAQGTFRKKISPGSWASLACMAMLAAPKASACEFIRNDNQRLLKEIQAQEATLVKFVTTIRQVETTCQHDQLDFSKAAAKAAGAESCEALRENAEMTGTLSLKSSTCASQVHEATIFMQAFVSDEIRPMEEGLSAAVELDRSLTSLQRYCAKELQATEKLRKKATEVLDRSLAATSKASVDLGHFQNLASNMKEASEKTAQARQRCNSDRGSGAESLVVAAVAPVHVPVPVPMPGARSENRDSTVTGKIREDQLSSGHTLRVEKREVSAISPSGYPYGRSAARNLKAVPHARARLDRSGAQRNSKGDTLLSFEGSLAMELSGKDGSAIGPATLNFAGGRNPAQSKAAVASGASIVAEQIFAGQAEDFLGTEARGELLQLSSTGQGEASVSDLSLFARVHAKYQENERQLGQKYIGELSSIYATAP